MSGIESISNPILRQGGLSALLPSGPKALDAILSAKSAEKAAKGFESVLLYKLLEEMKRTIPESGLLESGISEQVQDLFWYYLAQDLAEKGGLGIWRQLHRQMNPPGGSRPTPAVEQPS